MQYVLTASPQELRVLDGQVPTVGRQRANVFIVAIRVYSHIMPANGFLNMTAALMEFERLFVIYM